MIFEIKDKEFEAWKKFREEHKDCKFTSTIGGKFSFIFIPTGLGLLTEVRCNSCGEQKDITNIDNW